MQTLSCTKTSQRTLRANLTCICKPRSVLYLLVQLHGRILRAASDAATEYVPVSRDAAAPTGILFSSGTTGDPKAIPWSSIPPLRSAADAHCRRRVGLHLEGKLDAKVKGNTDETGSLVNDRLVVESKC